MESEDPRYTINLGDDFMPAKHILLSLGRSRLSRFVRDAIWEAWEREGSAITAEATANLEKKKKELVGDTSRKKGRVRRGPKT